MFWGLHLELGKRYSQCVNKAFHISRATLGGDDKGVALVTLHAILKEKDFILCYIGATPGGTSLQQSLDLHIAEGEEIVLYAEEDESSSEDDLDCVVHLTGYFDDDLYSPTASELLEAELEAELDGAEDGLDYSGESDNDEDFELPQLMTTKKRSRDLSLSTGPKIKKGKLGAATSTAIESFKTKGGTEVVVLNEGSGKAVKPGKKVFVKYTGRLAQNNAIFDSNVDKQRAFMFRIGKGEVIKGWDEGLLGMKVGGKRKLTVPPSQGYGSKGAPPKIPSNSTLTFDVELTKIK